MNSTSRPALVKESEVLVVGEVLGVPAQCPSVEAALATLLAGPAPTALCFDPAEEEGRGLGLLEALETLSLRIPVLLPLPARENRAKIFALSPYVEWLPRPASTRLIRETAKRVVDSLEGEAKGKLFRTSDYLQLAVLFGLSVRMYLRFQQASEVQINVVGGDVWSAFSGVLEGEAALRAQFLDTPESVEVAPIKVLPKHRQILASGVDFLLRCGERASRRSVERSTVDLTPAEKSTPSHDGTQPVDVQVVREIRTRLAAGEEPDQIDDFEELFAGGIRAALARSYEEAAASFRKALEIRPHDRRAQMNLARVLKTLGQG